MIAAASIKEVAAHAGVSAATVSNVLNRPEVVAKATLEKVSAAIAELGFVRNESARQLRVGRSRTIGLVVRARARHPAVQPAHYPECLGVTVNADRGPRD